MAAQSSTQLDSPNIVSFGRVWDLLTAPSAEIKGENKRRASTLAAILLVFAPLALATTLISPIIDLLNGEGFSDPSMPAVYGLIVILIAYALSRSKYFELGAYLTVAAPMIAVGGVILTGETGPSETALFFLTLSAILSSLLLDARATLITGLIASIILVLSQVRVPSPEGFPGIVLMFIILSTGIMTLVSYIRDGYVVSLEAAQAELQQRLVEVDQARAQAERSDQVKSAFLASMSHELRTPLNAIINFTRYVAKGSLGEVNAEQSQTLNEVVDSAKHLLNLINDVLDMSKIEAGSLNLFVEDNIDVRPLLESVIATSKVLVTEKPIEVQTTIDDNLPAIRGDRQRILQILLNIASNACKFTEQGSIKIRAYSTATEIVFAVQDTGPGIPAEDQDAVFDAFKQTNTGLRQGGGTGLGMPISKSLAEAHGGRLWLESGLDAGSTFYVALPIKSETLMPSLMS